MFAGKEGARESAGNDAHIFIVPRGPRLVLRISASVLAAPMLIISAWLPPMRSALGFNLLGKGAGDGASSVSWEEWDEIRREKEPRAMRKDRFPENGAARGKRGKMRQYVQSATRLMRTSPFCAMRSVDRKEGM